MKAKIAKIIELRKEKALSITKLSSLLDITPRTIYNWENGKSLPSKAELIAISHLYNVRLSEISDYKDFPLFYTRPMLIKKNDAPIPQSQFIEALIKQLKSIPDFNCYPILKIINEYSKNLLENKKQESKIRRLSLILDSIDSAIYIKDSELKIRYYNKRFLSLIPDNFVEEKIIGSSFRDIFSSDAARKEIQDLEKAVLSSNFPVFKNDLKLSHDISIKSNISIRPLKIISDKTIEIIVCISSNMG